MTWYENGNLEREYEYLHGKWHGRRTLYREDGVKESEGFFEHGKRQGVWVAYHPNGQLRSEVEFEDDRQKPGMKLWAEDGRKLR